MSSRHFEPNAAGTNGPASSLNPLSRAVRLALVPGVVLGLGPQAVVAGPTGGQVRAGQAAITQSGPVTTISQQSARAALDWQSFNVAKHETVQFQQPSARAATLNRIFDQNPSEIFGQVKANGRVVLMNPNGVFFKPGARVNVGSLVAGAMQVGIDDFMRGSYSLEALKNAGGRVVNQGTIEATDGDVALVGTSVANEGVIVATAGRVQLAAGEKVTVDFDGDGLLRFTVDEAVLENAKAIDDQVANTGQIVAEGGDVLITASAADGVFKNAINNSGVIRAGRVENRGGKVMLVGMGPGASVLNTGQIDASAADAMSSGGAVRVSAANISNVGDMRADAVGGEGGSVHLLSTNTTLNSGTISATSASGHGGEARVLGDKVGVVGEAVVDVSGATGGGEALIGGDYQGSNPDIANARVTVVGAQARIDASATGDGDGGKVIVWADGTTRYAGTIEARGGADGGDGGFAEVSGKNHLDFEGDADLSAPQGATGRLLLDPKDILVADVDPGPADNTIVDATDLADFGDQFTDVPDESSFISTANLVTLLDSADVILKANNDITIDDAVDASGNGNDHGLDLAAGRSIAVNADVTLRGGFSATANSDDAAVVTAQRDAGAGAFTMADGVTIDTTAGAAPGNIDITVAAGAGGGQTSGDITLANLDAGTATVTIAQDGKTDGSDIVRTATSQITADTLALSVSDALNASGAIGATGVGNAIATDVATLTASTVQGGIYVTEANDLAVGAAGVTTGGTAAGEIVLTAGGTLTLGGDIDSTDAPITLTAGNLVNAANAIDAGTNTVKLVANSGNAMSINGASAFDVSTAEVAAITAGTLHFQTLGATDDISIENTNFGVRNVKLESARDILDETPGDDTTDATQVTTTGTLTLDAGRNIGSGTDGLADLDIAGATAVTILAGGSVDLNTSTAFNSFSGTFSPVADAVDVNITGSTIIDIDETGNQLQINSINDAALTVQIASLDSGIVLNNAATDAVVAAGVTLIAGNGAIVDTADTTNGVAILTDGPVLLSGTSIGVNDTDQLDLSAPTGPVLLQTSTSGDQFISSGNGLTTTGAGVSGGATGNVSLTTTAGDITLTNGVNVAVKGATVTLDSAGAIADSDSAFAAIETDGQILLKAGGNVGANGGNPLNIASTNPGTTTALLDVDNAGSGDVFVASSGALNLVDGDADTVALATGGGAISASSPLTISNTVNLTAGTTFTAGNSGTAGDDLTINAAVTLDNDVDGELLTFVAGENIVFGATGSIDTTLGAARHAVTLTADNEGAKTGTIGESVADAHTLVTTGALTMTAGSIGAAGANPAIDIDATSLAASATGGGIFVIETDAGGDGLDIAGTGLATAGGDIELTVQGGGLTDSAGIETFNAGSDGGDVTLNVIGVIDLSETIDARGAPSIDVDASAGGNVSVTGSLTVTLGQIFTDGGTAIDITGDTNASAGGNAGNVTIVAASDLVTGTISAVGGNAAAAAGDLADGAVGGAGGNVSLTATDGSIVVAGINASAGASASATGAAAGANAGTVTVLVDNADADRDITLNGAVNAVGGTAVRAATGGTGGNVVLRVEDDEANGSGSVAIVSVNAAGGAATTAAGTGGAAGDVELTSLGGANAITLNGLVSALGGSNTAARGADGTVTLTADGIVDVGADGATKVAAGTLVLSAAQFGTATGNSAAHIDVTNLDLTTQTADSFITEVDTVTLDGLNLQSNFQSDGGNLTLTVQTGNLTSDTNVETQGAVDGGDLAITVQAGNIDLAARTLLTAGTAAVGDANGGNAGSINLVASGSVAVDELDASGGDGLDGANDGTARAGGSGNSVTVNAGTTIAVTTVNTFGGGADVTPGDGVGAAGGAGGSATLSATNGAITVTSVTTSAGASAADGVDIDGSDAGDIVLSITGANAGGRNISVGGALTAVGGAAAGGGGETGGDGGSVSVSVAGAGGGAGSVSVANVTTDGGAGATAGTAAPIALTALGATGNVNLASNLSALGASSPLGTITLTAGTGGGAINVGGSVASIETSDANVDFVGPVFLNNTGTLTVNTGTGAGDITFSDTLTGGSANRNLTLTAGTGNIHFTGQLTGGANKIRALTISSARNVTADADINVRSFTQTTGTGTTLLTGALVAQARDGAAPTGVSITNTAIDVQNGIDTAGAASDTLNNRTGGNITLNATATTLTIAGAVNSAGAAAVTSGAGGAGGTVNLTANTSFASSGTITTTGGGGRTATGGIGGNVTINANGLTVGAGVTSSGGNNLSGNGDGGAAGTITLNGGTGAVNLNAALVAAGGNSSTTGGTDDGNGGTVSITAGTSIVVDTTAAAITTTGGSGNDAADGGAVNFVSPVVLAGDGTFTINTSGDAASAVGSVAFQSTLDGDGAGAAEALTITAGGGDVQFLRNVGNGNVLGAVLINSARNVTFGDPVNPGAETFKVGSLTQLAGTGTTRFDGRTGFTSTDNNAPTLGLFNVVIGNGLSITADSIEINDSIRVDTGDIVLVSANDVVVSTAGMTPGGASSVRNRDVYAVDGNITTDVANGSGDTTLQDSGTDPVNPDNGLNTRLVAGGSGGAISADNADLGTNLNDVTWPHLVGALVELLYHQTLYLGSDTAGLGGDVFPVTFHLDDQGLRDSINANGLSVFRTDTGDIVLDMASDFDLDFGGTATLRLIADNGNILDNSDDVAVTGSGDGIAFHAGFDGTLLDLFAPNGTIGLATGTLDHLAATLNNTTPTLTVDATDIAVSTASAVHITGLNSTTTTTRYALGETAAISGTVMIVQSTGNVQIGGVVDVATGAAPFAFTKGISTNNQNVLVTATAGAINILQPLDAGATGDVRLEAATTITDDDLLTNDGKVLANDLQIIAGGAVTLDSAANDVDVLAADLTGAGTADDLVFVDTDDLTIGTVDVNALGATTGIDTNEGDVLLTTGGTLAVNEIVEVKNQATADFGDVRLDTGAAITDDDTNGEILAGDLQIIADGAVTLDSNLHDVNVLAVNMTDAGTADDLVFVDTDDLTIGTVDVNALGATTGIDTNEGDVLLTT
ncbi:MAG: filamentous hemagglutinin N-terminal domain-containing protein, partial [Gammaproteobacteria bacterium]